MRRVLAVVAGAGILLGACNRTTSSNPTQASGSLTVFAAASLTEALNDDKARLSKANPRVTVTYSFAGSQQLVAQIQAGAGADVVVTADQASMQRLVDAGLVDAPMVIAKNKLEIAVAPGNPKHISGLADLAQAGLRVVVADPSVPAGKYGRQALAHVPVAVSPVSQPLDVKAVVQLVASREADAGIVYVTDVQAAGARVTGVSIPDRQNVVATYLAATVKATKRRDLTDAFVLQLLSGAGRQALAAHGFARP